MNDPMFPSDDVYRHTVDAFVTGILVGVCALGIVLLALDWLN